MTTIDILKILADILKIKEFRIVKFSSWKLLQDFITPSLSNISLLEKGLNLSKEISLPFWDATLLLGSSVYPWNKDIINNADHHNPINNDFWIYPSQLDILNKNAADNLGINSLVKVGDGNFHIPMLDFHLPVSSQGPEIVMNILRNMNLKSGFILNSGNSYHFIGDILVSESQLINILAKALLYGPITDTRWIAHQILERSCTLRIGPKNNILPTLISHF